MKLAGSRIRAAGTVSLALVSLVLAGPAAQAAALASDTVVLHPGTFFREDILMPSNGSAWHVTVEVMQGSGRMDVYIIRTTDLIAGYPNGAFTPLWAAENTTRAELLFEPPNRAESFTLILDNLNNAREGDALPSGELLVLLVRPTPLRASAQAQAALATGTGICAAALAAATVAVAVYLKRRPRRESDEEVAGRVARIEIGVKVPEPPKGAWAREAPDEAEQGGEGA